MRKLPAGLFSLALAATAGIGWAQAGNAVSPSTQSSGPVASEAAPAPEAATVETVEPETIEAATIEAETPDSGLEPAEAVTEVEDTAS